MGSVALALKLPWLDNKAWLKALSLPWLSCHDPPRLSPTYLPDSLPKDLPLSLHSSLPLASNTSPHPPSHKQSFSKLYPYPWSFLICYSWLGFPETDTSRYCNQKDLQEWDFFFFFLRITQSCSTSERTEVNGWNILRTIRNWKKTHNTQSQQNHMYWVCTILGPRRAPGIRDRGGVVGVLPLSLPRQLWLINPITPSPTTAETSSEAFSTQHS